MMQKQTDEQLLDVLVEIRNLMRVAAREPVKAALEAALPDEKSRSAYQMFDGSTSIQQVRTACKMSPNAVVALAGRCTSMGLMEVTKENKRIRLFDLNDFALLEAGESSKSGGKE